MRCLDCDYQLVRLTQNRCPECGREFDPRDPNTFAGRRKQINVESLWFACVLVMVIFLLAFALLVYTAWRGINA